MGWFSRLKDKFRRRIDDVIYEGTLDVPRETPSEPPILTRFPAEELTAEGRAYLNRYPDVAAHKEPPFVYGERPRAHYLDHGKAEGRIWDLPEAAPAPEPVRTKTPKAKDEHFTFGTIDSELIYGTNDNQKHAANFDYLMSAAGPAAAYDYLVKHIPGGAALYRSAAQVAGIPSEETARIVNKYGSRAAKGRIEGDEYVFGAPFTPGVRYKLPR